MPLDRNGDGWLALVDVRAAAGGSTDPAAALLSMCAGLLGRGERMAVVDAGNRFDPFGLIRAAQRMRRDPAALLERVFISRAFTCHQVEALVARDLPAFLRARSIRSVLVLGLTDTFLDEAVPDWEARRLFERAVRALRAAATGGARIVLAEWSRSGAPGRTGAFAARLRAACDLVARLEADGDSSWSLIPREVPHGTNAAHLHGPRPS